MFIRTKKRVIAGGIGILAGAAALGLWSVPIVLGQTASGPQVTTAQLRFEGRTSIAGTAGGTGQNADAGSLEFGPSLDANTTKPKDTGSVKPARVPADHVPKPASNAIIAGNAAVGFNGITHRDQRLAANGNQFSLEPPDQGLAVGNGFVVEAVNLAIAVYSPSGTLLAGPAALSGFLGLAPVITRSSPPVFGPFISDPRVYYDAPTGRWFLTLLAI